MNNHCINTIYTKEAKIFLNIWMLFSRLIKEFLKLAIAILKK